MSKKILAALGLLALGLSGCGVATGAPPQTGEPALGALPAVTGYAAVQFPLDAFRTRPDEQLTLGVAHDRALRNCFARYGIDYPLPERAITPDFDRPIGVVSAADAARFGYKSPHTADVAATDRAKVAEKPMDAEALGVLSGTGKSTVNGVAVPAGGCAVQAQKELGNRNPRQENLVIGLASESYTTAKGDSRVRDAFARWSRCMSAAGFDYRDPLAANDDPVFGTGEPGPQEIATAKADVACRTQENVNGTWVAVITAYQNRIVTDHHEELSQYRQNLEAQLAVAARSDGK